MVISGKIYKAPICDPLILEILSPYFLQWICGNHSCYVFTVNLPKYFLSTATVDSNVSYT